MKKVQLSKERLALLKTKKWFHWLIATATFFFITWFFIGGSTLTSCSVATPAFNSDSSGGTAWFQWVSGNGLTWDYSNKSNFPVGETLERPQGITSEGYTTPYRVFSTITSPICGLNIMILLGFMSTALVMFGLIKWLLRSSVIGFFAGFAAAYVPYHQLKAQSHIVYVYSSIFIAIVWAYLWFIERPSYKRALPFVLLSMLGVYTDGYFVLLTAVLSTTLVGFTLLKNTFGIKKGKGLIALQLYYQRFLGNICSNFKYICFFIVGVLVLALPILYTVKSQSNTINHSLAAARGDIYSETINYGLRPIEFLLPAHNSWLMNSISGGGYDDWRLDFSANHGSNYAESTVYVGVVVMTLAAVALIGLLYKKARRTIFRDNLSYAYVTSLVALVGIVCVILSLPSVATVFGHSFRTPVWWLIDITSNWRVLARFFIVIQPLWVILAAIGLYFVTQNIGRKKFYVVGVICCFAAFIEYVPVTTHRPDNIVKDSPRIYGQIKEDPNVKVLAEYPLLDFNLTPITFTEQQLHGKPVYNANDSSIIKNEFNQSIAGLNNIQTLGVLKGRGVTHISIYGAKANNEALVAYTLKEGTKSVKGDPRVYSISADVVPRTWVLIPRAGFNMATVSKDQLSHHVLGQTGTLAIVPVKPGVKPGASYEVSFDIAAFNVPMADVRVKQAGKILWEGAITGSPRNITFQANNDLITVEITKPVDLTNLSAIPL